MHLQERIMLNHKYKNILQSLVILGLMTLLLWALAYSLFGSNTLLYLLGAGLFIFIINPAVSHRIVLRVRGAREMTRFNAPMLYNLLSDLAAGANLENLPRLYLYPSRTLNAFSFGSQHNSVIALSENMLHFLTPRELQGVLAHETGHIRNNDMLLLGISRGISWFTSVLSATGLVLLLISLPLFLLDTAVITLPGLLLLITAPVFSRLLWFTLSRTREYQADIAAVELTGDPGGLALALQKIQYQPFSVLGFLFFPRQNHEQPTAYSTHPAVSERIKRLGQFTDSW